jgi:fructosamine-3-kinase
VSGPLEAALERALGSAVVGTRGVSGGDVNRAERVELADGRSVFVKTQRRAAAGMFSCEARGLSWLAEPRALRVPEVLAASDGEGGAPAFLALEWIEPGKRGARWDEALGRGLAALHATGAASFGLPYDNWLATLAQPNAALPTWPRFYAERRLLPLLERIARDGHASRTVRQGIERVVGRIDALCGPAEPPSRLHGDLWGGNALCDARGEPVLIDPAVYGGHREVDLAMMRLFGGFSARCFAAYAEAYPLADGHAQRVALYQLYPLLAHVALFGAGYVGQLERALSALG